MESLASTVRGHGPEVVLIHGGMTDGELAWGAQEPLAERWRLRVVDRAGYGSSAHLSTGEDIQLDARLVVAALDEPVHLVGHSSGAIVALLVAAASPRRVRSLTVVEPPSYRFVDDPGIAHLADLGDDLWNDVELSDGDWLLEFFDAFGEEPPSHGAHQPPPAACPALSAFRHASVGDSSAGRHDQERWRPVPRDLRWAPSGLRATERPYCRSDWSASNGR